MKNEQEEEENLHHRVWFWRFSSSFAIENLWNKKKHTLTHTHSFSSSSLSVANVLYLWFTVSSLSPPYKPPPTPHILRISFNFMWKIGSTFSVSSECGRVWEAWGCSELSREEEEEEEGKDELLRFWLKGL
jgi:hypothetical protein